jgi:hypothetical protein
VASSKWPAAPATPRASRAPLGTRGKAALCRRQRRPLATCYLPLDTSLPALSVTSPFSPECFAKRIHSPSAIGKNINHKILFSNDLNIPDFFFQKKALTGAR